MSFHRAVCACWCLRLPPAARLELSKNYLGKTVSIGKFYHTGLKLQLAVRTQPQSDRAKQFRLASVGVPTDENKTRFDSGRHPPIIGLSLAFRVGAADTRG